MTFFYLLITFEPVFLVLNFYYTTLHRARAPPSLAPPPTHAHILENCSWVDSVNELRPTSCALDDASSNPLPLPHRSGVERIEQKFFITAVCNEWPDFVYFWPTVVHLIEKYMRKKHSHNAHNRIEGVVMHGLHFINEEGKKVGPGTSLRVWGQSRRWSLSLPAHNNSEFANKGKK